MPRRTTAFSDLAQKYFPNCNTPKNAVTCLNRWIYRCKELVEELSATGYERYNHRYLTPKQYFIITRYLGDPFDD